MLAVSVLVVLTASYLAIKKVPSLYESKALIVVTSQTLPEVLQQSTSFAGVIQEQTAHDNLVPMIKRHNLYPQNKDFEASLGRLRKEIKVDIKMRGYFPEGPEAVTIAYRYSDPQTAVAVVRDLVANFQKANESIRLAAGEEANRLTRKISEVELKLKQVAPEKDMALIRGQAAARMATTAATVRAQRITAESSAEALSDKEFSLQRQISDLQRQIAEQERVVRQQGNGGRTVNPAIGPLLVRKSELEAQLKGFQTQYTEKNPKVIAARDQLAEINKQIRNLEAAGASADPVSSGLLTPEALELKSLKKDLSRLETELEVTQRELGRKKESLATMPVYADDVSAVPDAAIAATMSQSRTEYDQLLVRYNSLVDRQDSMIKLAGISGMATPMFQVVDAPYQPALPVAPNRMFLYAVALGLSLVIGLLLVLLSEIPHVLTLNDEKDIEYFIGAPVMALIPRTLTKSESSRFRRIRMTRSFVLLAMGFGMIPVLVVILNKVQVFQILGSK